ncbi:MAG: extracellular solute-binding protein [Chloroflexi bacterium]|nr:extracellular solute-binding protein [Chloroflexota bacterium]
MSKNAFWLGAAVVVLAGMVVWRFLPGVLGESTDGGVSSPSPVSQPGPSVKVVHWATGHLTRQGKDRDGKELRLLPVMAEEFNKAGERTESGKRIVVEVHDVPSELQGRYLVERVTTGVRIDLRQMTNGYVAQETSDSDPVIVTPSDAHWLVSANHDAGRALVDLSAARSIVSPVIGIVTYEEMARCLGWPEKAIGYADIIALRSDPMGWARYPCARAAWGQRPLLAFTDPTTSSTGRSLHLALYSFASGKPPEQLTLEDVTDPQVVSYVKQFQGLIDHYLIGTTVLNTKVHQGPRYGHFFIMPEDNLIQLYEGTERAFIQGKKVTAPPLPKDHRMVMIYPREGSMPRTNCACIVQAEWVSNEQVEAAQRWIDFLRKDEQQRSFMSAGFRPGIGTDVSLTDPTSKINSKYGLDPTQPTRVLFPSLMDPTVAAAIDDSWIEVKRPSIVTWVLDTSGSMEGAKLQQAKDGMIGALDNMARNNWAGFLTFSDTTHTRIPVAPLTENRFRIADAVQGVQASGGTALYDAIKAAIEMTNATPGEADAIRAVIVLTDGKATRGETGLDDLIRMVSSDETPISSFSGLENTSPVDDRGRLLEKTEVAGIGLALAIETRYPIQIFFIGIGEDADMQIGRMLAEATGAEFQGVTENDLAQVLEEFSKYF